MGLFDRVILAIYTFCLSLLSLGLILVSFGLVSLDVIRTSLEQIHGHWEFSLIGLVFFLVSLRLLLAGIRSRQRGQTIVQETELGQVRISLAAVENLVRKVTRQIKGVREVKASVLKSSGGIGVRLQAVVSPDVHIPSISNEIQTTVQNYVYHVVGVNVTNIQINVENITNEMGAKVGARVE